ncbi:hypothetical protein A2380_02260 [candidate division WWE3 bacterium RIFOXYB1_FULL_43_24]|uniref:Glycosyltransferase RgtA/B/C/D-like domain-containing protein n=2 Tax=Katanobacteria TaxID=422282 RepID=A0A0G1ASU4_UNCKA|nr:MAG: hypothetical protein UV00_C0017G0029 [candidate division WWE3 bacterium GW2011_GWF1_42_14]KKS66653.1 MAG: hypothetical protein UV35_C0010G0001 [candidate division WWE3 bacterium GW2011_GWB1_42_6]OGC68760.1 MAG: hypothetical protein A2380_02260 [candidate division WWE3 bacterium RIFOXYB1_FULL_43_24]OGC72039.1 MAG: hypothetical protein A2414_03720 [candidate division WWE3 bacterium RIFOXYC1_FULL_42_13]
MMRRKILSKAKRYVPKILLFSYLGLFLLSKINLVIVDLGRHLTNGKIFLEQGTVLGTNLYSYTHPDFPVVTHHWGVGVIYYIVHTLAGFNGLTVLGVLLASLTTFFLYKNSQNRGSFLIFAAVALLLFPLFASRKEVRPESFSYLLVAVYVYIFESFKSGRLSLKFMYPLLFLLQVFWVNIHIFFVFGLLITFIYVLHRVAVEKSINLRYKMLALLFLIVTASLINPFFIEGLLTPFNIFKNYGYMIAENQSAFFMQRLTPKFEYFYFEVIVAFFIGCLSFLFYKKKFGENLPLTLVSLMFTFLALRYVRAFPLFVVGSTPLFVTALGYIKDKVLVYVALTSLLLLSFIPGSFFSPFQRGFGMGLGKDSLGSAEFFLNNGLKGPVFNNYDIGSYLIYGLYPREKVFVDNRPEAYPEYFFKQIYVPMQESEEKWKEVEEQYKFNVIFFYRRDFTPWAQPFLITRLDDPEWVPVYVDDFALILVRNGAPNEDLIKRYRLPPEMFIVTK